MPEVKSEPRAGKTAGFVPAETVQLPEETVNYLQCLDYELGGLQVLHTHALNAGTPEEKTAEIRRAFQEKYQECRLAREETFAAFGRPGRPMRIDYTQGVLYIG